MGNNFSGNLNSDFIFKSIKNLLSFNDLETLNENLASFRDSLISESTSLEKFQSNRIILYNYISHGNFNLEPCKELQEIRRIIMEKYDQLSDDDKKYTHEIFTIDDINHNVKKETIEDTYTLFQDQALNNAIIFQSKRLTSSILVRPFGLILL
jgi:hypothetical protein